jgi:hypothetical protein
MLDRNVRAHQRMDAASAPIANTKLVLNFVVAGIELSNMLKKRDAISAEMFPAPGGRLDVKCPPYLMGGREQPKGIPVGHLCHHRRALHRNDA